jgi:hypothetical protein
MVAVKMATATIRVVVVDGTVAGAVGLGATAAVAAEKVVTGPGEAAATGAQAGVQLGIRR